MNSKKENFIRTIKSPILVWDQKIPNTQLEDFTKKIEDKYHITLNDYWDLHKWSVDNFEDFWKEVWIYFDLKSSKPYEQVFRKTGDDFLDVEWFPGARINTAETLLRIRDDRTAIIYSDEMSNEETISYNEIYEEVKLYSAAFRKHGLRKGDVVACYMSNRKEAIFAYLASLSVGALFSGPQPFYGARAARNIIQMLEPKFIISVDCHTDYGVEFRNIDNLPEIIENIPSLEKVIIVPTRSETLTRSISNIKNGCFLHEFLKSGIEPDGSIPDIIFEQLPFDHPISINFTSGTTGLPKGPVHSIGTFLPHLIVIVFYFNLKPGDVLFSYYPVGWSMWNAYIQCLAWGIKLVLYAGNPLHETAGLNMWDIFAQYKVTHALLITSTVDKLEKMDVKPAPTSNLQNLRSITIGGSSVKVQNCLYIKNKVKSDVFVTSQYGATELFGSLSGISFNLPAYAGEIQVPPLGMNISCMNNKRSCVGVRGEMVITNPTIALPIYLWKDKNNTILKETYLSKFPGFWCQNDEILINEKTKGIIVFGRSDDTLVQNGDRFGPEDIYFAIHDMEEIQDYICVGQTRSDGGTRAVLFLKMKIDHQLTPQFKNKVEQKICEELWADCVPEVILEIPDIPYNLRNKRMESVVRKILATNQIPEVSNIKNPECLKFYCDIPEILNFVK